MTLRVVQDGGEEPTADAQPAGKSLAPAAPRSPGTVPLELAEELHHGEALLWWGRKDRIDYRPIAMILAVAVLVLVGVSLVVPEFWGQPLRSLWPPLAALLSPAAFVWIRERANLRATMVTDVAVIDVPEHGTPDRIAVRNVHAVRRDVLRGGVRLEGARHRVRIPPSLMDDARDAIAVQRRNSIGPSDQRPDDPLGWLP